MKYFSTDVYVLPSKQDEARLDIFVHGFCKAYQKVFFDIRVSYSHATRYSNQNLQQCYNLN